MKQNKNEKEEQDISEMQIDLPSRALAYQAFPFFCG
jgi:hypothetical protein